MGTSRPHFWPQSAVESAAGITPAPLVYVPRPIIRVRQHGAVLDGSTDDTPAFARALAVAKEQGGGRVLFDGPTKLKNLAMVSHAELIGVGNPLVNLAPNSPADVAVSASGNVAGSAKALTANASEGSREISVDSTRDLAVGDLILISERTFVYLTDGQKQEINRITALAAGNVVQLQTALIDSYATAASAQIRKLVPITDFVLSGFTIQNAPGANGGGMSLKLCTDFSVEAVGVSRAAAFPSLRLTSCAFGRVRFCKMQDGQGITPGGSSGLGIDVIEASHHIQIDWNQFSHYNENEIGGRCRHIQFTHNICRYADNAVNTHGSNNKHVLIADNDISDTVHTAIAVGYSAARTHDEWIDVVRNHIVRSGNHAISAAAGSRNHNSRITIADNQIEGVKIANTQTAAGIFVAQTDDAIVRDNRVDCRTVVSAADAGLSFFECLRPKIYGNKIWNCTSGYGLQLTRCADYEAHDNEFRNCSNYIQTSASSGSNLVRDNVADGTANGIESSVQSRGNPWDKADSRR